MPALSKRRQQNAFFQAEDEDEGKGGDSSFLAQRGYGSERTPKKNSKGSRNDLFVEVPKGAGDKEEKEEDAADPFGLKKPRPETADEKRKSGGGGGCCCCGGKKRKVLSEEESRAVLEDRISKESKMIARSRQATDVNTDDMAVHSPKMKQRRTAGTTMQYALETFDLFDSTHSGTLTRTELRIGLEVLQLDPALFGDNGWQGLLDGGAFKTEQENNEISFEQFYAVYMCNLPPDMKTPFELMSSDGYSVQCDDLLKAVKEMDAAKPDLAGDFTAKSVRRMFAPINGGAGLPQEQFERIVEGLGSEGQGGGGGGGGAFGDIGSTPSRNHARLSFEEEDLKFLVSKYSAFKLATGMKKDAFGGESSVESGIFSISAALMRRRQKFKYVSNFTGKLSFRIKLIYAAPNLSTLRYGLASLPPCLALNEI